MYGMTVKTLAGDFSSQEALAQELVDTMMGEFSTLRNILTKTWHILKNMKDLLIKFTVIH